MKYEPVIGLEVHVQLSTKTKAFCGCSTLFGQRPNSQVCPVCLGLPGSLPVLNRVAFRYAVKVALALQCEVQKEVKFDRKNYYYPDLPKNYQISQFDKPIAFSGRVDIAVGEKAKRIRIKRVHLEEDAGKLIHDTGGSYSVVDYNRTGVPLLEIVTEPDIHSPQEAYDYLTKLKAILQYLGVSNCDMEKGSLRCDANISVRPEGTTALGTKVELKNMNSFKGVKAGLEYEVTRQRDAVAAKERIVQETRLWDIEKEVTVSMRSKEEAHDYRYFPEPDLVPLEVDSLIGEVARTIPELPDARQARLVKDMALSEYDAGVLISDKALADYFEACLVFYKKPKTVANWIMGDIMAMLKEKGCPIDELGIAPRHLGELLGLIDSGSISGKIAKDVLVDMRESRRAPAQIVAAKGLSQVSDEGLLKEAIASVIARNQKTVADYKSGTTNAFTFLVGQVMKETKGKANPALVNRLLKENLGE